MNERQINQNEAAEILGYWQEEQRPVEVIARFSQGVTQSHPGRLTIEPEGQLVVADVIDKDHYLTTVLDLFAFESIKLSEMENAMTFEEPFAASNTFKTVTIACRMQ
ncbi:MAG TPA: hypothetical protein VNS63_06770 [Blastocatellia bacterium]|nr:hypothetical protein [Blastocatellia bacterium]